MLSIFRCVHGELMHVASADGPGNRSAMIKLSRFENSAPNKYVLGVVPIYRVSSATVTPLLTPVNEMLSKGMPQSEELQKKLSEGRISKLTASNG